MAAGKAPSTAACKAKTGRQPSKRPRRKSFQRLGTVRRLANKRERERASRLSDAMEDLRCLLWKTPQEGACSTILTLRTAIDYIAELAEVSKTGIVPSPTLSDDASPAGSLLCRYIETDMLTKTAERRPRQAAANEAEMNDLAGDITEVLENSACPGDEERCAEVEQSVEPIGMLRNPEAGAARSAAQPPKQMMDFISAVGNLACLSEDQLATQMSSLPLSHFASLLSVSSAILGMGRSKTVAQEGDDSAISSTINPVPPVKPAPPQQHQQPTSDALTSLSDIMASQGVSWGVSSHAEHRVPDAHAAPALLAATTAASSAAQSTLCLPPLTGCQEPPSAMYPSFMEMTDVANGSFDTDILNLLLDCESVVPVNNRFVDTSLLSAAIDKPATGAHSPPPPPAAVVATTTAMTTTLTQAAENDGPRRMGLEERQEPRTLALQESTTAAPAASGDWMTSSSLDDTPDSMMMTSCDSASTSPSTNAGDESDDKSDEAICVDITDGADRLTTVDKATGLTSASKSRGEREQRKRPGTPDSGAYGSELFHSGEHELDSFNSAFSTGWERWELVPGFV